MTESLQSELLATARSLPAGELPQFLGALAMVQAVAQQRLVMPEKQAPEQDKLIGVDEAAERLGVSRDYLYKHHAELPFTHDDARLGNRLLFSATAIQQYIKSNTKGRR